MSSIACICLTQSSCECRALLGGSSTFLHIFEKLGYYPDNGDNVEMEKAFLAAVLVFCEARRFVWIFLEVKERIRRNEEKPRDLDCTIPGREIHKDYAWMDVKDWGIDSKLVLTSAQKGVYTPPRADDGKAQTLVVIDKRSTLRDLSHTEGNGHLGLIMRDDDVLAPEGSRVLMLLRKKKDQLGAKCREPYFREVKEDEDDE